MLSLPAQIISLLMSLRPRGSNNVFPAGFSGGTPMRPSELAR